ncbi:MAG: hypothetical protein ACKO3G_07875, partial [Planctomycetaceae bacterium]
MLPALLLVAIALVGAPVAVAEEELMCRCHGLLGHRHGAEADDAFTSPTPDSGNGRRYAPDRPIDIPNPNCTFGRISWSTLLWMLAPHIDIGPIWMSHGEVGWPQQVPEEDGQTLPKYPST